MWSHFGPYHYARIGALKERFEVWAIQLFGSSSSHLWETSACSSGRDVETLFPDDEKTPGFFLLTIKLWLALRRASADVVLVPSYSPYPAWVMILWARIHGKICIMMNESNSWDNPKFFLKKWVKKFLVSQFDAGVVGGTSCAEYMSKLGMKRECIEHGYDCVDVDFFQRTEASGRSEGCLGNRIPGETKFLLVVARLIRKKNHDILLDAFKLLKEAGPQFQRVKLLVCGSGPEEKRLKRRVLEEEIDGVDFLGFVQIEDLACLYRKAEGLVLPSLVEPWGLVVNEALASGCPALVSNRAGCAADLIDEEINGRTFNPVSPEKICSAMIWLLTLSKPRLQEIRSQARVKGQKYTPKLFAENVSKLVELCR